MQQSALPDVAGGGIVLGRLLGLITPENIGELMMVSALLPRRAQPAWRGRRDLILAMTTARTARGEN